MGADVNVVRFDDASGDAYSVRQPLVRRAPRLLAHGYADSSRARPRQVSGLRRMPARYGHSCCACGPGHAWLLIFGGMTGGGYRGELNDVWVLRPSSCAADPPGSYEWFAPPVSADAGMPLPRGYHSATASADGRHVYIFGGISDGTACDELAILDTQRWAWSLPGAPGGSGAEAPCARFGHSATLFEGGLWVLGGGTGGDLLRDGADLADVWRLDAVALTWQRVAPAAPPPFRANLGRCHTAVLCGTKLLLFGGSMRTCSRHSWLDLRACAFGAPATPPGRAPAPRFTHVAARLGAHMVLACGWTYGGGHARGCLGDVWRLALAPGAAAEAAAAPQPPPGAHGGGAAAARDDDDEEAYEEDEEEDDSEEGEDEEDDAALAAYLTAAAAQEDDEDAADDAATERRLVRALVLAMTAGDARAVRRLLRRVQELRRAGAMQDDEEEEDEEEEEEDMDEM
jgi:hypothetical protein